MPDRLQLRNPEKRYPRAPTVWLKSHVMTQTEVSLRLAFYLLQSNLATSDITVALTAHELTRRDKPQFPVQRFLIERGFHLPPGLAPDDWQGSYVLKHAKANRANVRPQPSLHLIAERDGADLITTVRATIPRVVAATDTAEQLQGSRPHPTHHRLIVQTSRGLIGETRSSAEHKWLRNAIGRIMTFEKGGLRGFVWVKLWKMVR